MGKKKSGFDIFLEATKGDAPKEQEGVAELLDDILGKTRHKRHIQRKETKQGV